MERGKKGRRKEGQSVNKCAVQISKRSPKVPCSGSTGRLAPIEQRWCCSAAESCKFGVAV